MGSRIYPPQRFKQIERTGWDRSEREASAHGGGRNDDCFGRKVETSSGLFPMGSHDLFPSPVERRPLATSEVE